MGIKLEGNIRKDGKHETAPSTRKKNNLPNLNAEGDRFLTWMTKALMERKPKHFSLR